MKNPNIKRIIPRFTYHQLCCCHEFGIIYILECLNLLSLLTKNPAYSRPRPKIYLTCKRWVVSTAVWNYLDSSFGMETTGCVLAEDSAVFSRPVVFNLGYAKTSWGVCKIKNKIIIIYLYIYIL
jgi:hypothetical protein